jgi:hypothetical protein
MVATSLEAAQRLVELCEFSADETRANDGILIGKGNPLLVSTEVEHSITTCLTLNCGFDDCPDVVKSYGSALRPLQDNVTGGRVYQTGDTVLASQGNVQGHVLIKILHFYLLSVNNEHVPVAIGDVYRACKDQNNKLLRHSLSDSLIVEHQQTNFCVHVRDLARKVMLYPYHPGYAIIDPDRTLKLPNIIVPVFPQVGDMVLVKGSNDDDVWRAEIRTLIPNQQVFKGHFFIKHQHWQVNGLWCRESLRRTMETIHFKSILGLVKGQWQGPHWKDN